MMVRVKSASPDRISIYFLDAPSAGQQVKYAKYAELRGFEAVWVAETRMTRDAVSILGAIASTTNKIKLGSAVINCWSRIAPLIAVTWSTLDEIAPDRNILGIGAWWDPLAWKAGVHRKFPLKQMYDYVTIIKRLFALERVTYSGKSVFVRDISLDQGEGTSRMPKEIPVMIGATGFRMLELAGEIADGVIFNWFVPPDYNRLAVNAIEKGLSKSNKTLAALDRPQIIACSMAEDADKALDCMRRLVTLSLGMAEHHRKFSGLNKSQTDEIEKTLGGWPLRPGKLEEAMRLVDDRTVQHLTATGSPNDCRKKVRDYVRAGATLPMISIVGDNIRETIDAFAEGYM